jgi:hypothetical protein
MIFVDAEFVTLELVIGHFLKAIQVTFQVVEQLEGLSAQRMEWPHAGCCAPSAPMGGYAV